MSLVKQLSKDWPIASGSNCNLSHDAERDQTWENPCPFCLLHARARVFPTEHGHEDKERVTSNDINLYLKFLTYPSQRLDFYFKIFNQLKKQGEKELTIEGEVYKTVQKALDQGIWAEELEKNSKTSENKDDQQFKDLLNYRLDVIADWFLSRYQVFTAWRIYGLSKNVPKNQGSPGKLWPMTFLSATLFAYIFCVFDSFFQKGFSPINGILLGMVVPGICLLLLSFSMGGNKIHWISKLLLPQQLGAILGGYFLLIVVGSEFWDMLVNIINNISFSFLLLPLGLLLLIFGYLISETGNRLGFYSQRWDLLFHAVSILFIGCFESMIIGCLVFSFFGKNMDTLFSENYEWFLNGKNLGPDQLAFVAIYMALALFIGIFLQIFWQDKPITVSL